MEMMATLVSILLRLFVIVEFYEINSYLESSRAACRKNECFSSKLIFLNQIWIQLVRKKSV